MQKFGISGLFLTPEKDSAKSQSAGFADSIDDPGNATLSLPSIRQFYLKLSKNHIILLHVYDDLVESD
jgi:hypothetical protein